MTNYLHNETSPYLQQHKNNPVEWYPWSSEALELARIQDKPILLSIGYSACHWCHVMAHESFEDSDTAKIMNTHFINIKVDREERPDLDKVYQQVHQLLNQQPGGWPLTVFLTAEKLMPFFSGTYFPKERRYGRHSFKEVLELVAEYYRQESKTILEDNKHLENALLKLEKDQPTKQIENVLLIAKKHWQVAFDPIHGGIGSAPKFPMPSLLNAILYIDTQAKMGDPKILVSLVIDSLTKMAKGGIYDHLGGGFFRYSVDEAWEIPHFEKMLYDNAQLISLYSSAYIFTPQLLFRSTIEETVQWLFDEMKAPQGGFYSSINADSEGMEGKFYVWDPIEITSYLNQEQFAIFSETFGLDEIPNFEGKRHLVYQKSLPTSSLLEDAKKILKKIRNQRVRPTRDDKILCAWNALTLKGLSLAAMALHNQNYTNEALTLFYFIKNNLFYDNHLWVSLSLKQKGFLDDYAFLVDACWYLLQVNWHNDIVEFAKVVIQRLIDQFWDSERRQFYFTSRYHEEVIYRPRTLNDEVLPSGAALSILALQRFGFLLNNSQYTQIAEEALKAVQFQVEKNPQYYPNLMIAQSEYFSAPEIVLLYGKEDLVEKAKDRLSAQPNLHRFIFTLPRDLSPEFEQYRSEDDLTVSICEGFSCRALIKNLSDL